jgi:outer membrane immunogenic protein
MKKIIISLSFVMITGFVLSQSPLYIGTSQLNAGLGLSNTGIPIYIGFDHSIARDITIGAEASYRAYNENWENSYYNHNILGLSGNANYHFNSLLGISSRWDLYAGANLGFYVWTSPDGYTGNHGLNLDLGAQVGTRYYFTNSFGVNLEFGSGNAFTGGKLGLSFRL